MTNKEFLDEFANGDFHNFLCEKELNIYFYLSSLNKELSACEDTLNEIGTQLNLMVKLLPSKNNKWENLVINTNNGIDSYLNFLELERQHTKYFTEIINIKSNIEKSLWLFYKIRENNLNSK